MNIDCARIMIAKTTHVGDVVITLPLAGILKYYYPECRILFLAKGPCCDIAKRYAFIDEVYDENALQKEHGSLSEGLKTCHADIFIQVNTSKKLAKAAKQAGIITRIGSIYRWFNWLFCTHNVVISRESRMLNKRQLDLEYLKPLGIEHNLSYQDLSFLYQFTSKILPDEQQSWLSPKKFKLILHPTLITAKKYQWPLEYFKKLILSLDQTRFQIFITGVESDREYLNAFLEEVKEYVIDTVGKMNMDVFITFMQHCDGLIAGSTGPLHLAAALGIHALGVCRANPSYIRRWEAVGWKAETIAQGKPCPRCPNGNPCECIISVQPEFVRDRMLDWIETLSG